MVLDYLSAYRAVQIVVKNAEGKHTVVSSIKCGSIASIASVGGALLLGPLGLIAGAVAGSTLAVLSLKKFKSLLEVIEQDFTEEEREELMESIQQIISKFEVNDALFLMNLAQGNVNFQKEVLMMTKYHITEWQHRQSKQQYNVKYKPQRQQTNKLKY